MTVYVEALSLVNALGEDDDAILANLAEAARPAWRGPSCSPSTGSRLRSAT